MKLTITQIDDLLARMGASNVEEIEVIQGEDGRIQFYTIEVKTILKPLKRITKKEREQEFNVVG